MGGRPLPERDSQKGEGSGNGTIIEHDDEDDNE
jgi:hypothetical protein